MALEKKLACKFIRINTSNAKNGYGLDYEVGNVQAFIDEFKNKKIKKTRKTINERKENERNQKIKERNEKLETRKIIKKQKIKKINKHQVTNNFEKIRRRIYSVKHEKELMLLIKI